jgi:hypothetical protein
MISDPDIICVAKVLIVTRGEASWYSRKNCSVHADPYSF